MHHVLPVRLDQPPIDLAAEERIDVLVGDLLVGTIESHVCPVPHARHQLDPKQARQTEDRFALALGVGMQGIRLNGGAVFQEPVEDWMASQTPQGMKVVNSAT